MCELEGGRLQAHQIRCTTELRDTTTRLGIRNPESKDQDEAKLLESLSPTIKLEIFVLSFLGRRASKTARQKMA